MKKSLLIICILISIAFGSVANAQVTTVSLSVTPENAEVGDIITVAASSYNQDLTRSIFTWEANGKVIKQGAGFTSISFRKTATIPVVLISVSIKLTDGETIQQSVEISNQSVDLLWEAVDAYTPPFYKGKALPVTEGSIRFSPILARGNVFGNSGAKNNIYTWSRGNEVVGSASGTGKNSFPIIMDYMVDKEQIGIRVENIVNNSITTTDLDLMASDPQIMVYKENVNGFINWNNAVTDGYTPTQTTALVAAPYFITPKNLKDVVFSWKSDNGADYTGKKIIVTPDETGANVFEISTENTTTFFQTIAKKLLLNL